MSNQSPAAPFGPRAGEYALGVVAQALAQRATNQPVALGPEHVQRLGIARRHQRAIEKLANAGGRQLGWFDRFRGRAALHSVGRAVAAEVMAPTRLGDPRDNDPNRRAVETTMRRGLPHAWTDGNVNEALHQLPWAQAAGDIRPRFLSGVFTRRGNDRIAVDAAAGEIAATVGPNARLDKGQVLGRLLRTPERTQAVVAMYAGEPEGRRHGTQDPRRQAGADFAKRFRKGPPRWALRATTIAGPAIAAATVIATGGAALPVFVPLAVGAALNLRSQRMERVGTGARQAAARLAQEMNPRNASTHGNAPRPGTPPNLPVADAAVVHATSAPTGRQPQATERTPGAVFAGQVRAGSGPSTMEAGERPATHGTGQKGQHHSIG